MMRLLLALFAFLGWQCSLALGQVEVVNEDEVHVNEDFTSGNIWTNWCPCQIDMENAPVTFPFDEVEDDTRYAQIPVSDFSVGGNVCRSGRPHRECKPRLAEAAAAAFALQAQGEPSAPDQPERLGPSFFGEPPEPLGPSILAVPDAVPVERVVRNPYCTDEVELRAHRSHEEDECIQRQELRLRKEYRHLPEQAHWYRFRFRMPEEAEIKDRENSIRWVIAQWKEQPLHADYTAANGVEWGPSPFLALRFDDGVLHVTVQDENCRCLVASAPHPNRQVPLWPHPDSCKWTDGPNEGARCESPSFTVRHSSGGVLPTALGHWVEMRFLVQAGRRPPGSDPSLPDPARIEVMVEDRHIVTVEGEIGYHHAIDDPETAEDEASRVKFKIGHYRDYMPFAHTMDIDWVRIDRAD